MPTNPNEPVKSIIEQCVAHVDNITRSQLKIKQIMKNNGWITLKSENDLPKKEGWYRTIDHNSRYVNSTVKFDPADGDRWLSSFSHWKGIPAEPLPLDLP